MPKTIFRIRVRKGFNKTDKQIISEGINKTTTQKSLVGLFNRLFPLSNPSTFLEHKVQNNRRRYNKKQPKPTMQPI